MDDGFVHLMGDGGGYPLSQIYDPKTGHYFAPMPAPAMRETLKRNYLRHAGTDAARFDAVWPKLWQLTDFTYDPGSGLTAILDSGVLAAHPMLYGCIREAVDFTGEGTEDLAGHGTTVALIWRRDMLGMPDKMLVILKCVGADGRGRQEDLITALRWLRDYNEQHDVKIVEAVMSLGIYNKRFGLLACDGTCALCHEAVETAKTIKLVIAAGNMPGKTACPACAAFLPNQPNIIAITRPDEATAGRGTLSMSPGDADPEHVPFFTFVKTTPEDTAG